MVEVMVERGKATGGEPASEVQQYVVFSLATTEFAVEIGRVQEIDPVGPVTPVPNTPEWLSGVINLRGTIVSVVDLGRFFELAREPAGPQAKILVTRTGELIIALVVDAVGGIRNLRTEEIKPPLTQLRGKAADYVCGVYQEAGRVLLLLDLPKLLLSGDMQVFDLR